MGASPTWFHFQKFKKKSLKCTYTITNKQQFWFTPWVLLRFKKGCCPTLFKKKLGTKFSSRVTVLIFRNNFLLNQTSTGIINFDQSTWHSCEISKLSWTAASACFAQVHCWLFTVGWCMNSRTVVTCWRRPRCHQWRVRYQCALITSRLRRSINLSAVTISVTWDRLAGTLAARTLLPFRSITVNTAN